MKKEYEFNKQKYIIEKDEYNVFNYEEVKELVTDYFNIYDYIFGDITYNKIRLKGFCNKNNKKANKTNRIEDLQNYIDNYCAYNCKWFLLKKQESK
ncbi:MAG: YutD-like domain-containing protein [Bacilli bacterium]